MDVKTALATGWTTLMQDHASASVLKSSVLEGGNDDTLRPEEEMA
jgi:hypothetical protein